VANANGVVSIDVNVSDSILIDSKTFALNVASVDDVPIITLITDINTSEDFSDFNITVNATDTDGDVITYSVGSSDINISTVTMVGNVIVVSPTPNANGVVSIEVNATANGQTSTQTFDINVISVDDAPVLGTLNEQLSLNEDFSDFNITLTANDIESDTYSFSASSDDESLATVSVVGDQLVVHSILNASGATSINVIVTQDSNTSLATGVSIALSVSPVNDAPSIYTTIVDFSINEDNTTTNYELNVSDIDGDDLNLTVESNNTSILTVTPNWTNLVQQGTSDFSLLDFNLTTVENANGMVRITVTANDNELNATKIFDVNVTAVNDAPVLTQPTDVNVSEDFVDFNITLDATDIDGDTLTYNALSNDETIATVSVIGNIVTITSVANANGVVSIDVNVSDSIGKISTQIFTINIEPVVDPDFTLPTITIVEDISKLTNSPEFTIDFYVDDAEGQILNLEVLASSNSVLTTNNLSGPISSYSGTPISLLITPNENAEGIVEFEIKVTDEGNNTVTEMFTVTVENQQYHVISSTQTLAEFDSVVSQVTPSNLYKLRTYNDYAFGVEHIVLYDRFSLESDVIIEENYIEDIEGIVTHSTTVPDSSSKLKFDAPLDNVETSILFEDNDMPFVFTDVNSSSQKMYKKDEDGTINSYVLLNKEAKNEIYRSISANPKIEKLLNDGYTYLSLGSSKTLCDEDVQLNMSSCDQNNTLESVFGVNSNIEAVMKFGREWMYWNSDINSNPAYVMQKFSTLNPLEGILVKTTTGTTVLLPFDEDVEEFNDYSNLFPSGWILMSNTKTQSSVEIEASLTQKGKQLKYLLLLRDNTWQIYAPMNDAEVDSAITRVSEVKRYESYWVYFDRI
ncbi:tandem-95 repeat protein, partial [uncultured Sulfurimonas sp.]|uniref:tandem-95 repeat protein n=2 Tax=Sulfurimonas TaxID=202746 RepID=UPI0032B1D013